MQVSIVGLGYVGLPLALLSAKKYNTVAIDIDESKVSSLNEGVSYIDDVTDQEVIESAADFTSDISKVKDSDIIAICVPTPVDKTKQPDLSIVRSATESVARHIKDGALIIIESTVNPGVCEEVVIPIVEEVSGKKVGENVHVAHCPERINPGDRKWNVSNINRVVGSTSQEGLDRAYEFYSSIINAEVKKMDTIREAEAVKIVENSFRDINLAFVNELAMSFDKLGINLENVIDGAATKPFAFLAHHPGIGVGGHCIPVDPYYLIEYAGKHGFTHKFLSLAREINEGMPKFTFDLMKEAMKEASISEDKNVTLLGLSYKANVADLRESPSQVVLSLLENEGYNVTVYDPFFEKESTVPSLQEAIKSSRTVILATNHKQFLDEVSPSTLKEAGVRVFIDGKNSFNGSQGAFSDHGITYKGIGS